MGRWSHRKHTGYSPLAIAMGALTLLSGGLPVHAQEIPQPVQYQADMNFTKEVRQSEFSLREELKKPVPTSHADGLRQAFDQYVVGFMKALTADDGTYKGLRSNAVDPGAPDRARLTYLQWSVLTPEPSTEAARVNVSESAPMQHLKNSSKTLLQKKLMNQNELLSSLQNPRINFNLDFSAMFSSASPAAPVPRKQVQYGLVLKNIEPSTQKYLQAYYSAATTSTDEELARFVNAPKARTTWGVEPIGPRDDGSNPYRVRLDSRYQNPGEAPAQSYVSDLWEWVRLPSPSFNGSLRPTKNNTQTLTSTAEGVSTALPPMTLSLVQKEGLYSYEYLTDGEGKKSAVFHTFSMPLVGTLGLSQRNDEKMKPQSTSLSGLLIGKDLPFVTLNYLNQEQRYTGELAYSYALTKVVFKADTPKGWKGSDFTKNDAEKYTVEYIYSF